MCSLPVRSRSRAPRPEEPRVFTPSRATAVVLALVLAASSLRGQSVPAAVFDLVIRGGTVIDGMGGPGRRADIGLTGDRIARVAPDGIDAAMGRIALDATGLIVAPGFIDQHAHIQNIADYPLAETHVRQGITSIVSSPHSGNQVYPLDTYIATLKVTPNIGYFVGHSTVRRKVIGMARREATPAELVELKRLVAQEMRSGALGLSTGLAVPPGSHAPLAEIIELAKVAAAHGGVYVTHLRDDSAGVLDAIEEFIRVIDAAAMPGQISHHTVNGAAQWGWSERTLALVEAARARGLDITLDVFPYTGHVVRSESLLPAWVTEGAPADPEARRARLTQRMSDAAVRAKAEAEIRRLFEGKYVGDDLARVRFLELPAAAQYVNRTMAEVARDRGLPVSAESAAQLVVDFELAGGFRAVMESAHEDDLRRLLRHPATMFDTEGPTIGFGEGQPQPRTYGSFPRILGRYVREARVLTLEEALRKMTSMSADQIGQKDRGRIREGAFADITVFDAATIADRSTFSDPHQFPVGIRHVIVNGVPVIRSGAMTGEKPGRALKGPARAK